MNLAPQSYTDRWDLPSDWRQQAACQDMDPNLFMPEGWQCTARASFVFPVCEGCPVRRECLRSALDGQDVQGVWGGFFFPAGGNTKARIHRAKSVGKAREWLDGEVGTDNA